MGCILWVPYLVQRQVGGDNQRLSAAVSAVHDVVDLFQYIKQIFGKHFTGCWQSPEDAADAVLSDAQYSFLLFAKQQ